MSLQISKIAAEMEGSPTLRIDALVNDLKSQGRDVINLAAGAPDFEPPEDVKKALHEAVDKGMMRYTDGSGRLDVRKAISERFQKRWGLSYDPAAGVVLAPGGKGADWFALKAVVEPGDEVIIFSPFWPSYTAMVKELRAKAVFFNPWRLGFKALREAITSKTKAIIINSPSNPTGLIYSDQDFKDLAAVLANTDIWVISDEIYACIEFDSDQHRSLAQYPGMKDRVIICDGASKAFAAPGLRMGWAVGKAEVILGMQKMIGQLVGCPSSLGQHGLLAGLLYSEQAVAMMAQEYKRRRDELILPFAKAMREQIPGFDFVYPQGAFYWWFKLPPNYNGDSEAFCIKLLEAKGLGLVPGSAFLPPDDPDKGWVRLSYAASEQDISKALLRLAEFLLD